MFGRKDNRTRFTIVIGNADGSVIQLHLLAKNYNEVLVYVGKKLLKKETREGLSRVVILKNDDFDGRYLKGFCRTCGALLKPLELDDCER